MDAAGKSAEQQHEALTKARDRAERHRQQQNLRIAAAQSQQQAAAAEDGDTAYQGLMPDIADGDESAFAVGDADMLKMASLGVRDHTDELSDAEEELFINRGGRGLGGVQSCVKHISPVRLMCVIVLAEYLVDFEAFHDMS